MIGKLCSFIKTLLNLQDYLKRIEHELSMHKSTIESLTHQIIKHETIIDMHLNKKSLRK